MAKLERVTAKVFASDAPADKIGQFGSALAGTKLETGDVSTIQALPAYTEGWSSAVISQRNYPVLQETNGVMKNMSYQTAYIMQNGIAEYDPDTEYYVGSICKGIGNANQYASLGDENVGNAVTDSDYWKNITPVNYSNITNCITEIPQRIKYTLEDGTLTIKAGSVVIVPYGTEDRTSEFPVGSTFLNDNFKVYDTQFADGKFFVWAELMGDIVTAGGANASSTTRVFSISISGNIGLHNTQHFSTSSPNFSQSVQYYNTATNYMCHTNSSGVANPYVLSFPLIYIQANGTYTYGNILNIFNGFGYIGSTVWVDKGVKGLIPNGRNEDGTLRNIEWVNDKIIVTTHALNNRVNQPIFVDITHRNAYPLGNHYTVDSYTGKEYNLMYDSILNNYFYNSTSDKYSRSNGFIVAFADIDANKIFTSFNPKQPFRAVDYSEVDGSWVSSLYNIASDVTIANASTLTYDLSSYLPKDSNAYEVYLGIFAKTGNANGNSIEIRIGSSIATIDAGLVCAAQTRAANFITASGIVTIPVGADKIITVKNSGNASGTISLFRAGAYRRLGM